MKARISAIILILSLCFASVSFADQFTIMEEVQRPFSGTFRWWGISSGEIHISGTIDFRYYYSPSMGERIGFYGITYDGRIHFKHDYDEPDDVIWVGEHYSPYASPYATYDLFWLGIYFLGKESLIPDIFDYNSPFVMDIVLYAFDYHPDFPDVIEAELVLSVGPVPVPEASTILLFVFGLIGMATVRRKIY